MQRLIAALSEALDPVSLVRRAAEQMCLFTPTATGAAITLLDPSSPDGLVVVSAHGVVSGQLGRVMERDSAFQKLALESKSSQMVADAVCDDRLSMETQALAASLGVRTWIVIPLLHHGSAIGAMSVVAAGPNAFSAATIAAITSMSDFVGALISSQSQINQLFDALDTDNAGQDDGRSTAAKFVASLMYPGQIELEKMHHRLDALFRPDALRPVFQPIFDLTTHQPTAVEGLSRFPDLPESTVADWFLAARQAGRGVDLEVHATKSILTAGRDIADDTPIAINLSPLTAADPGVQDVLLSASRALTVELTEHEPFPEDVAAALQPLRDSGIQIAVDDTGAGYSTFSQILQILPDIVKIDAEFTIGVENDPARRALCAAIVALADEVQALTVAEAIETPAQLHSLRQLGVHQGQGYHLGRPLPAPHAEAPSPWTWPP